MKRICLVASFLCYLLGACVLVADPLLVIVLMVKNEEHVIQQTLEPYVQAGVDAYLIYDTGSDDATMEVAHNYLNDSGITNFFIRQEPFIDFATSRNKALSSVQELFPYARFMLMPDAEWYMHNVEGLIQFCKDYADAGDPLYLIRIMNHRTDFYTPRLMRCGTNMHFVGVVHEVPNYITNTMAPRDIFFWWNASDKGIEKTRARWKRDVELLLREYEEDPSNSRTVFYLAQTYDCLDDLDNARLWYEKRVALMGWGEENFVACYRLAQVYDRLDHWDLALCYYLKSYAMRPCRAEPLVKLAEHYWKMQEHALCFLFSRQACDIPYPEQELLSVDKNLYLFQRYDLLGIAAWYMHEYALGEQAVRQALVAWPDAPHLLRNLALYIERKGI